MAHHDTLEVRIAEELATHQNTDVTSLSPPLYDEIDIDALKQLLESVSTNDSPGQASVTFTYCDATVTVTASGNISIESTTEAPVENTYTPIAD